MTHRIGLLVFDGVDLLDVGGPYEAFLTANRLASRRGEDPPFEVLPVAVRRGVHTAYGGLSLEVDHTLDATDPLDVLIVPGVVDVDRATGDRPLVDAVRERGASVDLVASVCTGAFLLAEAGLLDGVPATTHFEDVDALGDRIGHDAARAARWVDAGTVVTSGGLASGIAMSLHLIERLHSRDLAQATARQLEYVWDPDDGLTIA